MNQPFARLENPTVWWQVSPFARTNAETKKMELQSILERGTRSSPLANHRLTSSRVTCVKERGSLLKVASPRKIGSIMKVSNSMLQSSIQPKETCKWLLPAKWNPFKPKLLSSYMLSKYTLADFLKAHDSLQ
jgi:hypothetical protein